MLRMQMRMCKSMQMRTCKSMQKWMQKSKWSVAGGITTSLLLAAPALAGGPPVAGHSFRAVGTTVTKASFREREREAGQVTIEFGEGTFEAPAVRGTYQQHGHRIRLRVDEALLEEWEDAWAEEFADHLRGEGAVIDHVGCRTAKAKLKARSRPSSFSFKAKYRFRCKASGDFGTRHAKIDVRFKGRGGLLHVALPGLGDLVPPPLPDLPEAGVTIRTAPIQPDVGDLVPLPLPDLPEAGVTILFTPIQPISTEPPIESSTGGLTSYVRFPVFPSDRELP